MPRKKRTIPSCRNCAGGLHPRMPCPGRNFDLQALPAKCPESWRWTPASYLGMSGVDPTPEYVREVIRKWRKSKEAER